MGDLSIIEEEFGQDFATWGIRLPLDAIESRQRGRISKAGWTIWYLFGSDGDKEYLDYYAMHRMTSDRHVRIYSDGKRESLDAIDEFYVSPKDPEEAAKAKAEFFARNKAVAKMLEDKGFSFRGDEPGSARVNRYLLTTPKEER